MVIDMVMGIVVNMDKVGDMAVVVVVNMDVVMDIVE